MAHDDIWDDSALVDSWNEALAEYKVSRPGSSSVLSVETNRKQKYHSIHATGSRIDDAE